MNAAYNCALPAVLWLHRIPALLCDAHPTSPRPFSPIVVASPSAAASKAVEAAGKAFEAIAKERRDKARGGPIKTRVVTAAKVDVVEVESEVDNEKQRLMMLLEGNNYYEILGLSDLNINASEDQIRKAHRRLIIKYHPDKQSQSSAGAGVDAPKTPTSSGEATDPLFLAIQKAYDVLSNEKSRRGFDSQYDFDDSIPSEKEGSGADFFKLYTPAFQRNSRWSVKKPVPLLGDLETLDEDVKAFYNFWFSFDSWRDFTSLAEHKPDEADGRDERRWMERENEKIISKKKKAEVTRIWDMTTRAYARDPRMIRIRKEEEDAKRSTREGKFAAKRAIEEAARRAEAEKAAAIAAEEEARKADAAAKKAIKDKEKRTLKKARNEFRRLLNKEGDEGEDELDLIFKNNDLAAIVALHEDISVTEATGGDAAALVHGAVAHARYLQASAEATKSGSPPPPPPVVITAIASTAPKSREWTVQETSMLSKGIAKYPPGTRNRWVMISEYVSSLGLGGRTVDECINKSRAPGEDDKKKANEQAYQVFLTTRKDTEILDKDAVLEGPRVTIVESKETKDEVVHPTAAAAGITVPLTVAATAGSGADGESADTEWTVAQQEALEKALRVYPGTLEKNERWKLIAEAVPGKGKKDCIARFKYIREKALAAKEPASAVA